jgi:cytochrome c
MVRGTRLPPSTCLFVSLTMQYSSCVAQGDVEKGRVVFRSECSACHSVEEGRNKVVPSLYNLFGTVGGTLEGYAFSDAMREKRIVWTHANLSAHTENPKQFTPGTKMSYPGLKDSGARNDLIAYLRVATAVPPTTAIDEKELEGGVFFYKHVRPIIHNYCDSCHDHNTLMSSSSIRVKLLQTYEEVTEPGIGGQFVVLGNANKSVLLDFLD